MAAVENEVTLYTMKLLVPLSKVQNMEPQDSVPLSPQQWTGNPRQSLGDPVPLCAWWELSQETFPAAERKRESILEDCRINISLYS